MTQPEYQVLSLTEMVARVEEAPNDLEKLGAIRDLKTRLAEVEQMTCEAAQAAGSTLAEIGRELGISKQAVGKRLRRTPPAAVGEKVAAPRAPEKVLAVRFPGGRTLLEFARQPAAPRKVPRSMTKRGFQEQSDKA